MCRGTQNYEIVRRGWGQRLEMLIFGGRGLYGDFEPSGQTLGMLILVGVERFRVETGRGSGGSGTDMGEFWESHWRC